MVHTATGMSRILIAKIQVIVFLHKTRFEHPRLQGAMARPRAALTSVGLKFSDENPHRCASTAAITIGSICKKTTASKSLTDQFSVNDVIHQMAGRCHLRAGLLPRQITAGIARGDIKLQRVQREFLELHHIDFTLALTLGAATVRSE